MKLDKILKGFNKTLAQLEMFIDKTDSQIVDNIAEQNRMEAHRKDLHSQKQRATKVVENIKGMIQ